MDLSAVAGITVVFCYPLTGRPGVSLPAGWDLIPGARGCTPQACSYRDSIGQLRKTGVRQVFGLSTQDTDYQREAANRLHLPFPLLSDELLQFATALSLPLLEVDELKLIKRLTMISSKGVIQKVFYPVFPPDQNVGDVMSWMRTSDGAALRRGEVLDEIG